VEKRARVTTSPQASPRCPDRYVSGKGEFAVALICQTCRMSSHAKEFAWKGRAAEKGVNARKKKDWFSGRAANASTIPRQEEKKTKIRELAKTQPKVPN